MIANPMVSIFPIKDYDLAATLCSGQAFRWHRDGERWVGVISRHWVRLHSDGTSISGETADPVSDWTWLTEYLQLDTDLGAVLKGFPEDEPMRAAVKACRGLRLLRQDPWECLASFICSSTKQIVQIRQIISLLCERYGELVMTPFGYSPAYVFPSAQSIAQLSETDLRACKMGFRAPYLLKAAQEVADGSLELAGLQTTPVETARERLMQLPGVGRKIADCVLLFAYGFQSAFPVDVWVMKGLQQLYFRGRRVNLKRLQRFSAEYFGPNGGYAQQYLFHYMRTGGNLNSRNFKKETATRKLKSGTLIKSA
jgi:N-glycosylase/DNA lyase